MATDAVTVERVARTPDELALLAAVAARPADDLPKLVYADWLDDRGDPLGPVLRRLASAGKPPAARGLPPGWADLVGLTWTRHLHRAKLPHRRAELLALARPALKLVAGKPRFGRPPPTPPALGTTRLGGDPDLPAGAAYPTAAGGVPLYFLGQFDLADLQGTVAGLAFPPAGLLSVFRPQETWGSCYPTPKDCKRLVRLTPPGTPLVRVPRPTPDIEAGTSPAPLAPFRPGLRLVETLRLPGQYREWPGVSVTDDEDERLDAVAPTNLGGEVFHLLGHVTHGNTGDEPLARRRGWVQLILVPPAEGPDFGQSDMSLSYQLPAADLRAGRFDRLTATFG